MFVLDLITQLDKGLFKILTDICVIRVDLSQVKTNKLNNKTLTSCMLSLLALASAAHMSTIGVIWRGKNAADDCISVPRPSVKPWE